MVLIALTQVYPHGENDFVIYHMPLKTDDDHRYYYYRVRWSQVETAMEKKLIKRCESVP